jgi:hypothetical protein
LINVLSKIGFSVLNRKIAFFALRVVT